MANKPSDLMCLQTERQLEFGCLDKKGDDCFSFAGLAAIEDAQDERTIITNARPGDPDCPDRTVDIKYLLPDCSPIDDDTCGELTCDDVDEVPLEYAKCALEVDMCVYEQFSLDANSYACTCYDYNEEFQEKLRRAGTKMIKKYQNKLIKALFAGVGTSYAGTAGALTLPLFDDAAKPQPAGLTLVQSEYSKQSPNCERDPILISGSDKLMHYLCAQRLYAGNTDGFDPNKSCFQLNNMYFDRSVQKCLQEADPSLKSPVLALLPGSVRILEWYCYDMPLYTETNSGRLSFAPVQSSGTVLKQKVDIGTGLIGRPFLVDMLMHLVECHEKGYKVIVKMRKDFGFFKIPQDKFCPDATYNYCTLWDIACQTMDCDALC